MYILGYYKVFIGILHIIMAYCEGGDLSSQLKACKGVPLAEDQVIEWFVQITLALQVTVAMVAVVKIWGGLSQPLCSKLTTSLGALGHGPCL